MKTNPHPDLFPDLFPDPIQIITVPYSSFLAKLAELHQTTGSHVASVQVIHKQGEYRLTVIRNESDAATRMPKNE